jgi:putative ABC transport system permease protein
VITQASTLLPVTPVLGVVLGGLLLAGVTTAALTHLGHSRRIFTAGTRAAVQLLVVSTLITHVVDRWWATLLFLVMMYAVAISTASGRITGSWKDVRTGIPIVAGTLPVLLVLMTTGLVPFKGIVLIPVTGILIGGAVQATVLAGRRALDELRLRCGEVEAALALGFTVRDAVLEICRPAAAQALIPGLDQTRTVGLVTLPGAFVGTLLGGASPVEAGAVQLFVLIAMLQVQAVAVALTIELIARGNLERSGA